MAMKENQGMPEPVDIMGAGTGERKSAETAATAVRKQFEDAHAAYLRDLTAVWEQTRKAVLGEFETHTSRSREAFQAADPKQAEAAWQGYVAGIRRAWDESQRAYEEAFRAQTRNLRDSFARIAEADLDPRGLANIATAVAAAANGACSTIGNWNLLLSCGVDPQLVPIIASVRA